MPATKAPTEEEILARFHRLRITINLSATKFGYLAAGSPNLVKRLEEGHTLREKSKFKISEVLDDLEEGHSVPVPAKANPAPA